jgi:Fe-S-cluster containining protein
MTLPEKITQTLQVFESVDADLQDFQTSSGLVCRAKCSNCCQNPNIAGTVLEFLPLAYDLYQKNLALDWFLTLKEGDPEPGVCVMLGEESELGRRCTVYSYRGLICRLFGYAARLNKYGTREMVTCSIIKSEQGDVVKHVESNANKSIPLISNYYEQLRAIDFDLARESFPMNVAIRKALEVILQYYAYRENE